MKTVGILGGMGSMATVDLFSKIIQYTKVTCDQDHLHIIIDNYAEIPDRTFYILNQKNSPLPKMIEAAKRLEAAGAELIVMPCNTAHYFYDAIQSVINIPMLSMMKETQKSIKGEVVLLATKGTYEANLYKNVYYPNEMMQIDISKLIYDYKKGHEINHVLKSQILNQLDHLDGIVLGCTELPLIFKEADTHVKLIDPTTILAQAVIQAAGGRLR